MKMKFFFIKQTTLTFCSLNELGRLVDLAFCLTMPNCSFHRRTLYFFGLVYFESESDSSSSTYTSRYTLFMYVDVQILLVSNLLFTSEVIFAWYAGLDTKRTQLLRSRLPLIIIKLQAAIHKILLLQFFLWE